MTSSQDADPSQSPTPLALPLSASGIVVEVFCGFARLSKAAADAGFQVVALDHAVKAQGVKVVQVDLTTAMGATILRGILDQPNIVWVHWAPPCGTFSRAREIRRKGAPLPLRNKLFIKGFPKSTRKLDSLLWPLNLA